MMMMMMSVIRHHTVKTLIDDDDDDQKGYHLVKALSGGVLPVSGVLADDEVEIFCKI